MMRALAELAMKGRTQAVLIAVLCIGSVVLAWVGAAVVALVILRKGINQGFVVLMWSALPALYITFWWGDTGPLSSLLGAAVVASVLRETVSWPLALMAAAFCGLLTSGGLVTLGSGILEQALQLMAQFQKLMLDMLEQSGAGQGVDVQAALPTAVEIAGVLGLSTTYVVIFAVMLARWWQSLLYNPGGFKSEFLGLRLPPLMTSLLIAVGVAVSILGPEYRFWALILYTPLVIAGFALIHAVMKAKSMGKGWLVLFYAGWLLLYPLQLGLLLLAVADSWVHFRGRLKV